MGHGEEADMKDDAAHEMVRGEREGVAAAED